MKDDSGRLSEILRHQATLLEHIVTDQRFYPDYFRVAFYGNFPVAIRNKQFVVSLPLLHNVEPFD
jgi:dedicator of cytokinesis protein 3